MQTQPADLELIEHSAGGDAAAFEILFDRYERRVFGYLWHATGDADLAADLQQEAFLELWKAAPRWRQGGSVLGFLLRAARSRLIDTHRSSRARQQRETLFTNDAPYGSAEDYLQAGQLRAAILRTIDSLPPRQREIFGLVRLGGLTYREAADLLRISERTVESHLASALKTLRDALPGAETEAEPT